MFSFSLKMISSEESIMKICKECLLEKDDKPANHEFGWGVAHARSRNGQGYGPSHGNGARD